jgi:hypothetical protein
VTGETNTISECNDGYTLKGDGTIKCTTNGTLNTSAVCEAKSCGIVKVPDNAKRPSTWKDTLVTGETNTITECNDGYTLKGDGAIKCTTNGTLNTSAVCEAKSCANVQPPANGQKVQPWKDTLKSDEFNTITCDELYTATNGGKLMCEQGRLVGECKSVTQSKWRPEKNRSIKNDANMLYSWPRDIRSVKEPTREQIEDCAKACEGATGCTAFVVRYDTAMPNMGDAICGLALKPTKADLFEPNPNITTYVKIPT